jgi:ubiquinone/menaquinone biosynthesis C-methylase UbiE
MSENHSITTGDYRDSHLAKGADYDNALAQSAYDRYMADCEKQLLLRIIPKLFPNKIPRYLDFACGTGRITSTVMNFAEKSTGVDISENMLSEARKKCPQVRFVHCDLTRESGELSDFDLVTAFRFFGNAQDELRIAALSAISRHTKPGAYLVINNHRNPGSIHNRLSALRNEKDITDLSHKKLYGLLSQANFKVERAYGIASWVIRHKYKKEQYLNGRIGKLLAGFYTPHFLASLCPDAIIVARKT